MIGLHNPIQSVASGHILAATLQLKCAAPPHSILWRTPFLIHTMMLDTDFKTKKILIFVLFPKWSK